jgi:cyclohexyl-isocyanide hydratase
MDPIDVVFLVYPGMTLLDLVGPYDVLHLVPGARLTLVAKTRDPVVSDTGVSLLPAATFNEIGHAHVLCVPGGFGQIAQMDDAPTIEWLRKIGGGAAWVTSVCTGAFLLGAAGLLRGYRATSHWASLPYLAAYGATLVEERVVIDRNRITGGGVTAGIDMALHLAARLASPTVAEEIQLRLEYDPAPPFHSGHPREASPAVVERARARLAERLSQRAAQARAAAANR